MNGLKKPLLALLLSAGFIANANAYTVSLATDLTAGSFSKVYTFTVASGYTASIYGTLVTTSGDFYGDTYGSVVSSISVSSVSLATTTDTETGEIDGTDWTSTNSSWEFSASNLVSGIYTLTITGTAYTDSTLGGSLTVSETLPVPEPETYGLMLLGLGVLGFITRRKTV